MIDNNAVLYWEKKIKPRAFHQLLNAISEPDINRPAMCYGYAIAIGYTKRFSYFALSLPWWSEFFRTSDFDKAKHLFAQILAE